MSAPLQTFSLEGKGLKLTTAADLEPHIKQLRAFDDVQEVRFSGNTLGVEACKLLGHVLSTKKSLEVADLSDIFTGRLLNEIPEAISSLLTGILNLPKVHTVNLNDNAFGLSTQAPIVAFLASHVPLQHLSLNNNGLGPHAGIMVADALSELHAKKREMRQRGQHVPYLETVICGRNRLENGSMTAWAKAFSLHDKIKTVKMIQNGIRPQGICHLLADGLSHARDLSVLDLQDNTFTLTGAKELAKAIPLWTQLHELGLSDTYLKTKGSALLCQALGQGKNKSLHTLRLQYTDITSPVLQQLVGVATNSLPRLKKLELNGNKFSEDDEAITALRGILDTRRKEFGGDKVTEADWGLDSLSDLDSDEGEDDEEEDEDEAEEIAAEERREVLTREAEEAQEAPVIQVQDKSVDDLAEKLEKAEI